MDRTNGDVVNHQIPMVIVNQTSLVVIMANVGQKSGFVTETRKGIYMSFILQKLIKNYKFFVEFFQMSIFCRRKSTVQVKFKFTKYLIFDQIFNFCVSLGV